MKTIIMFILSLVIFCFSSYSQNDSLQKERITDIFGSIYPSFSATYSNKHKTLFGFEINTAQVGYNVKIKNNIKGIILYNVNKTTGDISVSDTSNNALIVNYFKGSDYTAFLKQAEVLWLPSDKIEVSIGQILSEQYITLQDKLWGYRYVAFTMQEIYKFGHPADFGFRLAYKTKKIRLSTTISNGEGPFYKQDNNGLLQYAVNFEYKPSKSFIVKWYSSVYPNQNQYRWCHNVFSSYKTEKFTLGLEGSRVLNDNWKENNDFSGVSFFSSYQIKPQWSIFFREDLILKSAILKDASFSIFGLEYKFEKNLMVSLNQRLLKHANNSTWQTFFSVGFKF